MWKVTYFVRTRAKEGRADEVLKTLLTKPAVVGEELVRIDETWESEELVGAHESSGPFLEYRETLRPLIEGESVLWGNTEHFAVKGYEA